jgi:hypothetical protein
MQSKILLHLEANKMTQKANNKVSQLKIFNKPKKYNK